MNVHNKGGCGPEKNAPGEGNTSLLMFYQTDLIDTIPLARTLGYFCLKRLIKRQNVMRFVLLYFSDL